MPRDNDEVTAWQRRNGATAMATATATATATVTVSPFLVSLSFEF